jgi:hypothetical protein
LTLFQRDDTRQMVDANSVRPVGKYGTTNRGGPRHGSDPRGLRASGLPGAQWYDGGIGYAGKARRAGADRVDDKAVLEMAVMLFHHSGVDVP